MSAKPDTLEKEIVRLNILVKHLNNELRLTYQEKEDASKNYLELYRHLDDLVKEKTAQLQNTQNELAERNKALEKALEDAQQANRAKSEFLSNMSHELKTPLNAILGYSELAINSAADTNILKSMQSIHASGVNLLTLINDLIDLSRLESGKFELNSGVLNIQEFMGKLEHEYTRRCLEKKLTFVCSWSDEPRAIRMDPARLRQVLIQLLGNALKYTSNGEVHFILKITTAHKKGSCNLEFLIEDTGKGMKPGLKKGVWALFNNDGNLFTPIGDGIGLGLALASRIVAKMGGQLSVRSTPGRGSVFILKQKNIHVEQWADPHKTKKLNRDVPTTGHGVVLIADDDPLNVDLLRILLKQRYHFSIQSADDGKEAVELAISCNPRLIFMDINMPQMDGFTATREIKSNGKMEACPVVFLSALITEAEKEKARAAGSELCLTKPINTDELYAMVDEVLQEREDAGTSTIRVFIKNAGFSDLVKKLGRTLVMSEISCFADEILQTVNGGDTVVRDWANQLKICAADFDVVQLRQTLEIL